VAGPHSRHHDRSVPVAHGSRPLAVNGEWGFFYPCYTLRSAPAQRGLFLFLHILFYLQINTDWNIPCWNFDKMSIENSI
jgi:hypothetical protein